MTQRKHPKSQAKRDVKASVGKNGQASDSADTSSSGPGSGSGSGPPSGPSSGPGSCFSLVLVLALIGLWSSMAVVYFDVVDYESVLGRLSVYDADADGDFDLDDAKVLLERPLRGVRLRAALQHELRDIHRAMEVQRLTQILLTAFREALQDERDEEASREKAEEASREKAEEASREMAEEASREKAEEASREMAEEASREKAEEASREKAEEASREMAEEASREKAEEASREKAEEASREKAEEASREKAEEASRKKAEEASREKAEEASREKAEEASRKKAEEASREKAEEASREKAEEASRKKAEEASREKAEEATRKKAEEASREKAEEASREKAEEASREKAEEASRKKAEEASREKAEEASREKAEEASRKKAEEASREKAEEASREKAEEASREKAKEASREKAKEASREKAEASRKKAEEASWEERNGEACREKNVEGSREESEEANHDRTQQKQATCNTKERQPQAAGDVGRLSDQAKTFRGKEAENQVAKHTERMLDQTAKDWEEANKRDAKDIERVIIKATSYDKRMRTIHQTAGKFKAGNEKDVNNAKNIERRHKKAIHAPIITSPTKIGYGKDTEQETVSKDLEIIENRTTNDSRALQNQKAKNILKQHKSEKKNTFLKEFERLKQGKARRFPEKLQMSREIDDGGRKARKISGKVSRDEKRMSIKTGKMFKDLGRREAVQKKKGKLESVIEQSRAVKVQNGNATFALEQIEHRELAEMDMGPLTKGIEVTEEVEPKAAAHILKSETKQADNMENFEEHLQTPLVEQKMVSKTVKITTFVAKNSNEEERKFVDKEKPCKLEGLDKNEMARLDYCKETERKFEMEVLTNVLSEDWIEKEGSEVQMAALVQKAETVETKGQIEATFEQKIQGTTEEISAAGNSGVQTENEMNKRKPDEITHKIIVEKVKSTQVKNVASVREQTDHEKLRTTKTLDLKEDKPVTVDKQKLLSKLEGEERCTLEKQLEVGQTIVEGNVENNILKLDLKVEKDGIGRNVFSDEPQTSKEYSQIQKIMMELAEKLQEETDLFEHTGSGAIQKKRSEKAEVLAKPAIENDKISSLAQDKITQKSEVDHWAIKNEGIDLKQSMVSLEKAEEYQQNAAEPSVEMEEVTEVGGTTQESEIMYEKELGKDASEQPSQRLHVIKNGQNKTVRLVNAEKTKACESFPSEKTILKTEEGVEISEPKSLEFYENEAVKERKKVETSRDSLGPAQMIVVEKSMEVQGIKEVYVSKLTSTDSAKKVGPRQADKKTDTAKQCQLPQAKVDIAGQAAVKAPLTKEMKQQIEKEQDTAKLLPKHGNAAIKVIPPESQINREMSQTSGKILEWPEKIETKVQGDKNILNFVNTTNMNKKRPILQEKVIKMENTNMGLWEPPEKDSTNLVSESKSTLKQIEEPAQMESKEKTVPQAPVFQKTGLKQVLNVQKTTQIMEKLPGKAVGVQKDKSNMGILQPIKIVNAPIVKKVATEDATKAKNDVPNATKKTVEKVAEPVPKTQQMVKDVKELITKSSAPIIGREVEEKNTTKQTLTQTGDSIQQEKAVKLQADKMAALDQAEKPIPKAVVARKVPTAKRQHPDNFPLQNIELQPPEKAAVLVQPAKVGKSPLVNRVEQDLVYSDATKLVSKFRSEQANVAVKVATLGSTAKIDRAAQIVTKKAIFDQPKKPVPKAIVAIKTLEQEHVSKVPNATRKHLEDPLLEIAKSQPEKAVIVVQPANGVKAPLVKKVEQKLVPNSGSDKADMAVKVATPANVAVQIGTKKAILHQPKKPVPQVIMTEETAETLGQTKVVNVQNATSIKGKEQLHPEKVKLQQLQQTEKVAFLGRPEREPMVPKIGQENTKEASVKNEKVVNLQENNMKQTKNVVVEKPIVKVAQNKIVITRKESLSNQANNLIQEITVKKEVQTDQAISGKTESSVAKQKVLKGKDPVEGHPQPVNGGSTAKLVTEAEPIQVKVVTLQKADGEMARKIVTKVTGQDEAVLIQAEIVDSQENKAISNEEQKQTAAKTRVNVEASILGLAKGTVAEKEVGKFVRNEPEISAMLGKVGKIAKGVPPKMVIGQKQLLMKEIISEKQGPKEKVLLSGKSQLKTSAMEEGARNKTFERQVVKTYQRSKDQVVNQRANGKVEKQAIDERMDAKVKTQNAKVGILGQAHEVNTKATVFKQTGNVVNNNKIVGQNKWTGITVTKPKIEGHEKAANLDQIKSKAEILKPIVEVAVDNVKMVGLNVIKPVGEARLESTEELRYKIKEQSKAEVVQKKRMIGQNVVNKAQIGQIEQMSKQKSPEEVAIMRPNMGQNVKSIVAKELKSGGAEAVLDQGHLAVSDGIKGELQVKDGVKLQSSILGNTQEKRVYKVVQKTVRREMVKEPVKTAILTQVKVK